MAGVALRVVAGATIAAMVAATLADTAGPLLVLGVWAAGAAAYWLTVPSVTDRTWSLLPGLLLAVAVIAVPPWPGPALVISGALISDAVAQGYKGRDGSAGSMAGLAVMFLALAGAHHLELLPSAHQTRISWTELGAVVVVTVSWFAFDSILHAASADSWPSARPYLIHRALDDWPMALVMTSAALTLGVLWSSSRFWAIVAAAIPFVIAHHLGNRVVAARHISDLTIRALGRLPEAAGLAAAGHTRLVADLAVAMGKVEGLVGQELAELEVAAQLHDIGLLNTTRPDIVADGFSLSDVAQWGAQILSRSSALDAPAAIVAASREPYRLPGRDPDPDLDRRAQIIQVACRVVESVESGTTVDDAVEALYDRSLFQFDPHVVSLVRPATQISATVLDELAGRRS